MLNIARDRHPGDNLREQLERRGEDQLRTEVHQIEVVGQVGNATTMPGVAEDARVTCAVVTDAADVLPRAPGEKDVGAGVEFPLRTAIEPPTQLGERTQMCAVVDGYQDIGVLRTRLGSEQGAE